jgi:N-formylglutamate deformylase
MKSLILHIPHSSTHIPFFEGYVDAGKVNKEIDLLTDWYTDELFLHSDAIKVIAPFSRVFCDVERFIDDDKEPMAKKGMGLTYTLCDDGSPLRNMPAALRHKIIDEYYNPHHNILTDAVDQQLKIYGEARIIDCHSYPNIPLNRDQSQLTPRPDFNIGISSYHTPASWIPASQHYFEQKGFSLGVDWPYSGTMVPIKHYHVDPNVQSIMLEINRDLYLNPVGNIKNDQFSFIQGVVADWLTLIGSL